MLEFPKRPTLAHAEQPTLGFAILSTYVLEIAKLSLCTLVPVTHVTTTLHNTTTTTVAHAMLQQGGRQEGGTGDGPSCPSPKSVCLF